MSSHENTLVIAQFIVLFVSVNVMNIKRPLNFRRAFADKHEEYIYDPSGWRKLLLLAVSICITALLFSYIVSHNLIDIVLFTLASTIFVVLAGGRIILYKSNS
jgi:hypothetical protein